jgi:small subunit ribosomal protein S13
MARIHIEDLKDSSKCNIVNISKFLVYCIQHGFYCGILFRDFGLSASEYKHILRIAGKDIEGGKKLIVALSEIKGVGYNFAQVLIQSLNINPNMRVGFLTENDIHEIEQAISNPAKAGIPQWYLNRRKNMDDGSNNHMITSDLDFAASNDIEREKLVMSWRGYRHMFGLRVRGQCTRTTGRRGGAVGVKKVKMMPGAAPAAPPEAAAAAPPAGGTAGGTTNTAPPSKEPAKK